jgi:hypothetical protein
MCFWAGELCWRISATRTIFVLFISSRRRKVRVVDISLSRQLDNSIARTKDTLPSGRGYYPLLHPPHSRPTWTAHRKTAYGTVYASFRRAKLLAHFSACINLTSSSHVVFISFSSVVKESCNLICSAFTDA